MSRATALISRVNSALNRTQAFDRTVYLRTVTVTGGDPLIGRGGTASNVDKLLNPQPLAERMGRVRVAGGHVTEETLISPSGHLMLADDYMVIISPTAASLSDLQNPSNALVFKDSSGAEEVLRLLDYESASLNSTDVLYTVYVRSVKRP